MTSTSPCIRTLSFGLALCLAPGAFAKDDARDDLSEANKEGRIWAGFALNPQLNPFEFTIDVDGETAKLGGTVDDGIDRDLAEQVALGVSGITRVQNDIVIDAKYQRPAREAGQLTMEDVVQDANINARVRSKLAWNSNTDGFLITTTTHDRKVFLTGIVDSEKTREMAGDLAGNTTGVRAVDNKLKVQKDTSRRSVAEMLDDVRITWRVRTSFAYSNYVDTLYLNVLSKDGVVTITGTASASQRALVKELAENVRGVKRVDVSGIAISS